MAILGLLPSSLHPGRSVILLLILTVQLASGEKASWKLSERNYIYFSCEDRFVLAPGPIWGNANINITLLRDTTSGLVGQRDGYIDQDKITSLIQGYYDCLNELFICVGGSLTQRFCPSSSHQFYVPDESQRCGYIIPCSVKEGTTDVSKCPDGGCYLRLQGQYDETLYIYIYNNKERLLKLVYEDKRLLFQSSQRDVIVYLADLHLAYNSTSASSLLIGYQVFKTAEILPTLKEWLPSDCFINKIDNDCLNPNTPSPNPSSPNPAPVTLDVSLSTKTPTSSSDSHMNTSESGSSLPQDPSNGKRSAEEMSTRSDIGVIVGSIFGGLFLVVLILLLILLIRRGSLPKPSLAALRERYKRRTTNTNGHTNDRDSAPTEPYDDVALYSNTTGPLKGPNKRTPEPMRSDAELYQDPSDGLRGNDYVNQDIGIEGVKKPRTSELQYAQLDLVEGTPGVVRRAESQVKYATVDLNKMKMMPEPAVPEAEYANVEVTGRVPVMGNGEPEEESYATVDKTKKIQKEPGVYIVENEEYGTAGSTPEDNS